MPGLQKVEYTWPIERLLEVEIVAVLFQQLVCGWIL
jgi:hypothetical protein